jgi:hypothetical protein
MSATKETGLESFWSNGLPASYLPSPDLANVDPGTERYWAEGLPTNYLYGITLIVSLDPVNVSVNLPSLLSLSGGIQSTVGFATVAVTLPGGTVVYGSTPIRTDPIDVSFILP